MKSMLWMWINKNQKEFQITINVLSRKSSEGGQVRRTNKTGIQRDHIFFFRSFYSSKNNHNRYLNVMESVPFFCSCGFLLLLPFLCTCVCMRVSELAQCASTLKHVSILSNTLIFISSPILKWKQIYRKE